MVRPPATVRFIVPPLETSLSFRAPALLKLRLPPTPGVGGSPPVGGLRLATWFGPVRSALPLAFSVRLFARIWPFAPSLIVPAVSVTSPVVRIAEVCVALPLSWMLLPALTEILPPPTAPAAPPMRAIAPVPAFRTTLPPALIASLPSRGGVALALPRAAPLLFWPPVRITSPPAVSVSSEALRDVPPSPPILEPVAVPVAPPPFSVTVPATMTVCLAPLIVAGLSVPAAPALIVIEPALTVWVLFTSPASMKQLLPFPAVPPLAPPVIVMFGLPLTVWLPVEVMPALLVCPTVPPVILRLPVALMIWSPPLSELMNAPLPLPLAPPCSTLLVAVTDCWPWRLWNTPEFEFAPCAGAVPPVTLIVPLVLTVWVSPPTPGVGVMGARRLFAAGPTIVIEPDWPAAPAGRACGGAVGGGP